MSREPQDDGIRFFHRGGTTPTASMAALIQAQQEPETLYCGRAQAGDLAVVVSQVRRAVTGLLSGAPLAGDCDSRRHHLLEAIAAAADTPEARLRILQHLGRFRFDRSESQAMRRRQVTAVVGAPVADLHAAARKLSQIWKPCSGAFLDKLLHRPAEAARAVIERLDGGHLTVVRQRLEALGPQPHLDFSRRGIVAAHQGDVVWLLGGVEEALQIGVGPQGLTGLHLLLLHQVVAGLLAEAGLEALPALVVADTLIRGLAGQALDQAVEEFCAAWESRATNPPQVEVDPGAAVGDPEATTADQVAESWEDCVISEADLRPEAFIPRTLSEQRAILRDMFGDDWTEEDERELTSAAA